MRGPGLRIRREPRFREAPIFYWLYTLLIVVGAGVVLIPGFPLVRMILLSQVLNGMLLPFVLIFMILLINKSELMKEWTNSRMLQPGLVGDGGGHDRADAGAGGHQFARGAVKPRTRDLQVHLHGRESAPANETYLNSLRNRIFDGIAGPSGFSNRPGRVQPQRFRRPRSKSGSRWRKRATPTRSTTWG